MDQATTISKETCVPATAVAATSNFLHARKIGNVLCALRPNKYMGTRVLRIDALLQTVVVCAFAAFGISSTATADTPGSVLAWGAGISNTGTFPEYGQSIIPAVAQSGVSAIACGMCQTIILKEGKVYAWGENSSGECLGTDAVGGIISSSPTGAPVQIMGQVLAGVTAIASGMSHTIALKNGEVLAWGNDDWDQCVIPDAAKSGVTAIAGGHGHCVALKDGSVLAWGENDDNQCDIPGVASFGVSAIASGYYHTIALKDGAVLAWGRDTYGQCTIPVAANSGVTSIAGGAMHTIALKNGAVLAWGAGTTNTGEGNCGQSIVPTAANSGVTAIAGGSYHTLALKNGAVIAWGAGKINTGTLPDVGQSIIPTAANSGVTAIAGGSMHTIALKSLISLPTITTVSPTSGPLAAGTSFTITGTNLTGATSVKVNGVAATSVVVVSATSITAKTPAGTAGAKSLTVTTAGGTATKASAFTYIAPPAITSIAPVLGTIDGGTTLRITGTNFSGATRVKVGTREAINFTVISSTQLQCDSPVGNSGVTSITVTTPIGDGTKANAFTYVVLVPRIKSIVPNTGTTLGDTSVIINGDNLSHATSVMFGSALATNVHFVTGVDGKIAISANTPVQGFGLKNVVVSTAGGTATKTSAFTYLAVAPTGVTASTNLCTTINVAWDSYVGATGYQVFRDSNLIETVGLVTTFSDWYGGGQYSIKALGAFGISLESASVYGSLQTGPICDGDWPPHLGFTGDDGNPIDPAPMGVQLYLQTVQQLPDVVFVKCSDTEIAPENMKITNALVPTTNDPSLIISDQVQTPQIAPANTIEIVGTLLNPESAAATPPTIKNLPEISLAKESGPTRIRPIDLDQDGQADICQLRGGDFDLNGLIDDRDMSILLHMIGTEPLHGIGDLDGNGLIDSADMSLLLLKM